MRVPDPKANTTTEAYLAYKAGYLEESELKPVLYEPYLHFDAWLAYWAGLTSDYPLDKNGEPEMITDEEALVAYLSGVTDTYPEEIKDPYDVRIVGYLKYLVSARWGRPEYPVNNEEFYLSTMKPPVVPSGDPSSDIEMDDTVEAPFIDLKMYGDTFQQTYTGKNLLYIPNRDYMSNGIVWSCSGNSVNGSGSFSGQTWSVFINSATLSSPLPAATYTLSVKNPMPSPYRLEFSTWDENNTRLTYIIPSGQTYVTFTRSSSIVRISVGIAGGTIGASVSLDISDIQLEASSSPTSFEPYVGGTPAPNPDYPQAVNVVTGDQTVTVNGKNLFLVPETETKNGVTLTKNSDGSFNLVGTATSNATFNIKLDTVLESGTYTLSKSGGNFNAVIQDYSGSSWLSQLITLNYNSDSVTSSINPVGNSTSFVIQARSGNTYNLQNVQVQLEKGSSVTQFVAYKTPQNYPISLGSTELCKIGDYQDYIYKSDDDWYVHKACGKNTVDTSTITNSTSYTNIDYARVPKPTDYIDYDTFQYTTLYFTHAICYSTPTSAGISGYDNAGNIGKAYLSATKISAYVGFEKGTSLSDIQTALTGSTFYYPLATPTDTQITNSELISQLDALMEGGSYEGKTYIKVTATDPNLPGLLYVEAGKYD